MNILITGAAGNLGGMLARHLLDSTEHRLNLMVHTTPLSKALATSPRVRIFECDLGRLETLSTACAASDALIHFAGVLFAPGPEDFLSVTNTLYARNLVDGALSGGVRRFVINSFPHVEGPTTRDNPCTVRQDLEPVSVHAKTRLDAEKYLFKKARGTAMTPVSLRTGMVYGSDVLMIAFARKLARLRLLGVWREPLPVHLVSIDDFNSVCRAALERPGVSGIYPIGDDSPTTLQEFLDLCCREWGLGRPWRVPVWSVYAVARACEAAARLLGTRTPFTKDFIDIGRVPYFCDTRRMKEDLLADMRFPSVEAGKSLLV